MARIEANGIELEYETLGDPGDPTLLLVMGLGGQLTRWPEPFCAALADGGFHVVRYDNRDSGLFGTSSIHRVNGTNGTSGTDRVANAPYLLADMADDAVALLDALGIPAAHLVGASMGGMIVQQLAIDHPERALSLCSIMSTTGDRTVGRPMPAASRALFRPPAASREKAIEQGVRDHRALGSPGYPEDSDRLRERVTAAVDRSYRPDGAARQLAAIMASPDRTRALRDVRVPTLVIHGEDDPLVNRSGGEATAAAIPGAELMLIPGMGHDLPQPLHPMLAGAILRNAAKAS